MPLYNRSASFFITLSGAVVNYLLFVNVLTTWRAFNHEPESEWEASEEPWRVDVVKFIWGLLSLYFMSATAVCATGFVGIVKSKPSLVRFYRDYSIADFAFCALSTALATYGAFRTSSRADVCEEFSRHPELLRDTFEMGLNLENCERWLERAVFAVLAVMFIVMFIRLHFLLAVANYYAQLIRPLRLPLPLSVPSSITSPPVQRIFLLSPTNSNEEVEMVYTPVPLSSLPKEVQLSAREAWVSPHPVPSTASPTNASMESIDSSPQGSSSVASTTVASAAGPRHHHRHHRRSSRPQSTNMDREQTGRIRLSIQPDEGLLPSYGDVKA
ncbi:hypothetical protein BDQ17DRAFT_1389477 [Cyathus striatus]|nr:hypothetical protein BDQ17DRAFT_1389477 [Cyathus striatus]